MSMSMSMSMSKSMSKSNSKIEIQGFKGLREHYSINLLLIDFLCNAECCIR